MEPRRLALLLAGAVILADRLTKYAVESTMSFSDRLTVISGFFAIVHIQNRGMAFGLFSEGASAWRPVILAVVGVVVLLFVVGMIRRLPREQAAGHRFTPAALGLILGGAVGNLYDRLARGSVTDFLDFHAGGWHWPAFNVADSAITIGAALLALDLLRSHRRAQSQCIRS